MSHADPRVRAVIRARHFAENAEKQMKRHAQGIHSDAAVAQRLLWEAISLMKRIESETR